MSAVQPPVLLLWWPLVLLGLSSGFCGGCALCSAGLKWAQKALDGKLNFILMVTTIKKIQFLVSSQDS